MLRVERSIGESGSQGLPASRLEKEKAGVLLLTWLMCNALCVSAWS